MPAKGQLLPLDQAIVQRGDQHWSRRHPEKIARGDRQHGSRTHLEEVVQRLAKLTPQDVLEIRRRAATGELQVSIANDFNIKPPAISNIVLRNTWNHIL